MKSSQKHQGTPQKNWTQFLTVTICLGVSSLPKPGTPPPGSDRAHIPGEHRIQDKITNNNVWGIPKSQILSNVHKNANFKNRIGSWQKAASWSVSWRVKLYSLVCVLEKWQNLQKVRKNANFNNRISIWQTAASWSVSWRVKRYSLLCGLEEEAEE